MTNSLVKIIFQRSAFASCRHARALARVAGLPRQVRAFITIDESFKVRDKKIPHNKFDEMSSLEDVNWIPLRIHFRSRNTQPHLKLDICHP